MLVSVAVSGVSIAVGLIVGVVVGSKVAVCVGVDVEVVVGIAGEEVGAGPPQAVATTIRVVTISVFTLSTVYLTSDHIRHRAANGTDLQVLLRDQQQPGSDQGPPSLDKWGALETFGANKERIHLRHL